MGQENRENLATELLHELKMSAKRWFIIAIVELFVIVALILLWVMSPVQTVETTTYTQGAEDTQDSTVLQSIEENP